MIIFYQKRHYLFLGLSNPLDMIYHIQPWMIIILLPLTIFFEAIPMINDKSQTVVIHFDILWYILFGSFLAFLMEISEFLLLTYTSSLTLSIAGIVKEIFTLYLAIEYYGDKMSFVNFIGLTLCLTGISLHVFFRARDVTLGDVITTN